MVQPDKKRSSTCTGHRCLHVAAAEISGDLMISSDTNDPVLAELSLPTAMGIPRCVCVFALPYTII